MNRYYETITDCSASIKRAPSNTLVKAYARRAAARAALGQYDLAHEDYVKALDYEPQNQSCLHGISPFHQIPSFFPTVYGVYFSIRIV